MLSFPVTFSSEGLDKLTVNVTLSPSLTLVLSASKESCGRSGSEMVTVAVSTLIVAFSALDSVTEKVLSLRWNASGVNALTVMLSSLSPGSKVSLPFANV